MNFVILWNFLSDVELIVVKSYSNISFQNIQLIEKKNSPLSRKSSFRMSKEYNLKAN